MIYHSIFLNFGPRFTPSNDLFELIESSYPPPLHPARRAGLFSSRSSLLENLRKIYPEASFTNLQLADHGRLKDYPDLTVSLSHSALAGASAVAFAQDYLAIGIDIEPLERVVKENIVQRITTQNDLTLTNIQIWCLKEAIYKCVSNSKCYQGVLEFRDMEIKDHQWIHSPSGLNGEWKIWNESNHQVALATLKNQNS